VLTLWFSDFSISVGFWVEMRDSLSEFEKRQAGIVMLKELGIRNEENYN